MAHVSPAQLSAHAFTVTILQRITNGRRVVCLQLDQQAALLNGEGGRDMGKKGERWKKDLELHEAVTKVRFM